VGSFPQVSPQKSCTHLSSPLHATCPAHQIYVKKLEMRIQPVALIVQNSPLYLLFSPHHDHCACLHYYTYAGLYLGHFYFVLVQTHTGQNARVGISWKIYMTHVPKACTTAWWLVPYSVRLQIRVVNNTKKTYGLDGLGIESRWGRDSPHPPRTALGPTQLPIKWYRVFSPGVNRAGCGVACWFPFSAEINPLNAELNPICHPLALLGAHPILHISRIRVKERLELYVHSPSRPSWPGLILVSNKTHNVDWVTANRDWINSCRREYRKIINSRTRRLCQLSACWLVSCVFQF
jgi:hypothetical protein